MRDCEGLLGFRGCTTGTVEATVCRSELYAVLALDSYTVSPRFCFNQVSALLLRFPHQAAAIGCLQGRTLFACEQHETPDVTI